MSKEIKKRKSVIATDYMAPCFEPRHGMQAVIYVGYVGSVGPAGESCTPLNASSPQAKKEYDKKYKRWGRLVMLIQLARGDD